MQIVAYATLMLLIFPLGTPTLYAALIYINREQLERIRRAETVAEAEQTKFKQRKRSIDLHLRASRGSAHEPSTSSSWSERASHAMESMVEVREIQARTIAEASCLAATFDTTADRRMYADEGLQRRARWVRPARSAM
jgi:hypothetical protein